MASICIFTKHYLKSSESHSLESVLKGRLTWVVELQLRLPLHLLPHPKRLFSMVLHAVWLSVKRCVNWWSKESKDSFGCIYPPLIFIKSFDFSKTFVIYN